MRAPPRCPRLCKDRPSSLTRFAIPMPRALPVSDQPLNLLRTGVLEVLQGRDERAGARAAVLDHGVRAPRRARRPQLPHAGLGLAMGNERAALHAVRRPPLV